MPKSAAAAEVVGQSSPTCEAKLFLGALGALRKSVTPTTKSVTHGRTLTAGDNTLSSPSVALPIMAQRKSSENEQAPKKLLSYQIDLISESNNPRASGVPLARVCVSRTHARHTRHVLSIVANSQSSISSLVSSACTCMEPCTANSSSGRVCDAGNELPIVPALIIPWSLYMGAAALTRSAG